MQPTYSRRSMKDDVPEVELQSPSSPTDTNTESPGSASVALAGQQQHAVGPTTFHLSSRREALLFTPAIVVAMLFLALTIGYTADRYRTRSVTYDKLGMVPRLSALLIQSTFELSNATVFLVSARPPTDAADRDIAWPMQRVQDKTMNMLLDLHRFFRETWSADEVANPELDVNPFTALPFAPLRQVQFNVLKRSISAQQLLAFYDRFAAQVVGLLSYYAAREASASSSALFLSIRSATMAARTALDRVAVAAIEGGGISSPLWVYEQAAISTTWARMYLNESAAALLRLSTSTAPLYSLAHAAAAPSSALSVVESSFSATEPLDVTLTSGLTVANISQTMLAFAATLRDAANAVGNGATPPSTPWTEDPRDRNRSLIAIASVAVGLLGLILLAVVIRTIRAALQEAQDAMETNQMLALDASYRRMDTFIDAIATLRVAGIRATEGKQVHPVERDVYSLEPVTKQLLAYLHPLLPMLKAQSLGEEMATMGATVPGAVSSVSGGLVADPLNAATNPPSSSGTSADLIPTRLVSNTVSLLFVDLEGWQSRITSESAKSVPRDFSHALQRMAAIVEQHGGKVHDVSCAKMIAAWNLDGCYHEGETSACQAVHSIHKQLAAEYSHLRFAVTTGECSVGVAGTSTLKTFVCVGPPLALGGLLLRLNRLHGSQCIVDDTTFAKLDGQTFRTRPVEVVAVDANSRRCAAFELVMTTSPADKDGRNASWNEAFDEYKSGNVERARFLLRRWQQNFGESKSLQRLSRLISENPPRQCTYKHNDDGLIEDELL